MLLYTQDETKKSNYTTFEKGYVYKNMHKTGSLDLSSLTRPMSLTGLARRIIKYTELTILYDIAMPFNISDGIVMSLRQNNDASESFTRHNEHSDASDGILMPFSISQQPKINSVVPFD